MDSHPNAAVNRYFDKEMQLMSSISKVTVTCPKCQKEHPFTVWNSINTSLDPQMKEAVKNRSAFLFECPSCGEKTYADYGFLYHQMEDKIMIYYVTSDENSEEVYNMLTGNDPAGMICDMRKQNYLIRIVRSQNELREKIAIFDEGLDDRIIEIFKIFILAAFQDKHPYCESVEILYFNDQGENYVQIISDGKTQGSAQIPESFYEELCQKYAEKIPDIRADEPYIDRQWALEIMNSGQSSSQC